MKLVEKDTSEGGPDVQFSELDTLCFAHTSPSAMSLDSSIF